MLLREHAKDWKFWKFCAPQNSDNKFFMYNEIFVLVDTFNNSF